VENDDRRLFLDVIARLERQEQAIAEIRRLVGPSGIPFPDGTLLVQTIHGTKYFIDPTDLVMAPQLVVYRQWESDVSACILNCVNENSIFMDVGANFGYLSCLAASRIGNKGTGAVISIEPNAKMLKLLRKNIQVNWSMAPIEVHECAVCAATGYVTLNIPEHAANASIANDKETPKGMTAIVKASTVDTIAAGRIVDVLKIDVEGHEVSVLRGARKTIERSTQIIVVMEWSLNQMKCAGFSASDLLAEVEDQGLSTFELVGSDDSRGGKPGAVGTEILPTDLAKKPYGNIVLRHKR
jgi:FkbM family methyltransferase